MNLLLSLTNFANKNPLIVILVFLLIFNWVSYGLLKLIAKLLKLIASLFKKKDIQGDKLIFKGDSKSSSIHHPEPPQSNILPRSGFLHTSFTTDPGVGVNKNKFIFNKQ